MKFYMIVGRAICDVWNWRPLEITTKYDPEEAKRWLDTPFSDGCFDWDEKCAMIYVLEVETEKSIGTRWNRIPILYRAGWFDNKDICDGEEVENMFFLWP